jgi:predicted regulator of Ras-like GTPase activity (Roadblock/LC7/MglB family)
MAPALGAGLGSLFDLAGVHGSFLVTGAGAVAARALSEMVDDATLAEVAGRVIRLGETLQTVGIDTDLSVLRFAEHKLYVKSLPGGVLCIVTAGNVSLPALRMAANLVARKVGPEMVRVGVTAAPAVTAGFPTPRSSSPGFAAVVAPARPTSPASVPGSVSSASAGTRMYRGRPVG